MWKKREVEVARKYNPTIVSLIWTLGLIIVLQCYLDIQKIWFEDL